MATGKQGESWSRERQEHAGFDGAGTASFSRSVRTASARASARSSCSTRETTGNPVETNQPSFFQFSNASPQSNQPKTKSGTTKSVIRGGGKPSSARLPP